MTFSGRDINISEHFKRVIFIMKDTLGPKLRKP
jgi:hypothetical protein